MMWILGSAAVILIALCLVMLRRVHSIVLAIGPLTWTLDELCRHFLITGDTGSGKTTRGINLILSRISERVPNWGGIVIGVKGDEHRFLESLLERQGRTLDLIHLQVRPEGTSRGWHPPHRFNLVGNRSIPWTAHAKMLVDTATSLVEGRQSAFFKSMAQLSIAKAFELLEELQQPVHLVNAYEVLTVPSVTDRAVRSLQQLPEGETRRELAAFFEANFTRAQAVEQREAVEGTIRTYLGFFLDPDIAAVFSSDQPDTFQLSDVDFGKILTVSIPPRLVVERRYIQTYLKLLFYLHGLNRFSLSDTERKQANLLLLVADEFQEIATASEDGMSDHRMVDRLRAAKLAVIAAMQSEVSLDPTLGPARRKVLTLNLRSRLAFRAADGEGAKASSEFVGTRKVWKRSRSGRVLGPVTYTSQKVEKPRLPPSRFLRLKAGKAVVVHPRKRYCVLQLPRTLK